MSDIERIYSRIRSTVLLPAASHRWRERRSNDIQLFLRLSHSSRTQNVIGCRHFEF